MISMTTVARIGERDVFVLVIANPVVATISLREILGFAAKAASLTCWVLDGRCFGHGSVLEVSMGLKYRKLVRLLAQCSSHRIALNVSPHYAAPLAAYYNDSFIVGRGKRG